jgi:1-acyl-sn-glycerol-3-phosphate acyltransferase
MIDKSTRRHVVWMVRGVSAYLKSDVPVIVFPEGTTAVRGSIRQFAPASFQSAIDSGRPIAVVALEYRSPAAPGEDVSWGDESMWANCCRIARQARGIECRVRLLEVIAPPFAMTRRELADRTSATVANALSAAIDGPPDGSAGFAVRRPSALPR